MTECGPQPGTSPDPDHAAHGRPYWRDRQYIRWFAADTASALGVALRGVAGTLVAYMVSGSLTAAGSLTAVLQIYGLALSLVSGTVVDRYRRRTLIIINLGVQLAVSVTIAVLLAAHMLVFAMYAVLSFVLASVSGLCGTATDAAMRAIVQDRDYAQAKSVNQGRDATITLAGGPAGGALYGVAPWLPYVMSAVVLMLGVLGMSGLTIHDVGDCAGPSAGRAASRRRFAQDFMAGWRFFCSCYRVPAVTALCALSNMATMGLEYAVQLYLVGTGTAPFDIGLINTFTCLAGLAGAILANRLVSSMPTGVAFTASTVAGLMCFVPVWFFHGYAVLVAALCVSAAAGPLASSSMLGFVFSKTPDGLQGRMYTCVGVPASALAALTPAFSGWVLDAYGFGVLVSAYSAVAAVCLALLACLRRVREIPAPDGWADIRL